ncbi:HNH endonuclease signature motif containing protein [Cupriavidus metallidurans]|uniref:HNH endonuclease signature motif containing protein n=1 Tax=Cupriavidus metallidurans TaxID=119219 RepID=UPI00164748B3|nr:HNH endonuclease signature motif containing protein [Cupriavidus metallidurans]
MTNAEFESWMTCADPEPAEKGTPHESRARAALGALCRRGHDHEGSGQSLRYKSGSCVQCQAENAAARRAAKGAEMDAKRAEWVRANRDKVRAYQQTYKDKNRELLQAKARAYQKANRDKLAARLREYRRNNPEVMRAIEARRVRSDEQRAAFNKYRRAWAKSNRQKTQEYAHKRSGVRQARLPAGTIAKIGQLQKWCCAVCRKSIRNGRYHKDHIVALANGGDHAPHNIQLLCPTCNLKKGVKHPVDFMQSRGFLL